MTEPYANACAPDSGPIEAIVARMEETARGLDFVTAGDLIAAFGRRSFLPALLAPALVVVSPLSGVPLVPTVCGLIIALVAGQMLWPGYDALWIPGPLARLRLRGDRMRRAISFLGRGARWLDGRAKIRLEALVRPPGRRLLEFGCLLSGLAMPFLELVPFSSSILALAVVLMATGMLARDGAFALSGLVAMAIAPLLPLAVFGVVAGA
jgi:hypothetical protein